MAIKLISPNFSDLYTPNLEIGKFPDGDSHVRIPQISSCRGEEVIVFHRLYPNQNDSLIELLLILDAVKYEQAKSITVVCPYLPYARQDKQTVEGEIASAHVICNFLAKAGCDKLVVFDCHFLNAPGEATHGGLKIQNICMSHALVDWARKVFGGAPFEIIGPDDGSNYLVECHGGKHLKKVRKEYESEKIAYRHIETMEGDFDVKDKNVLILDDMISTGNTMITAMEKMFEAGAKRVACAATHGLFLYNCLDRLRKRTELICASDSMINSQAFVSIKPGLEELFSGQGQLELVVSRK